MSRRTLLWLVPLFITLHNLEELLGIRIHLEDLSTRVPGWVFALLP
jgi:hypothetical protein